MGNLVAQVVLGRWVLMRFLRKRNVEEQELTFFVFLAVILLVFSMILVLPSAFLTDNNSGMTQFFGYVALFAFLWLVLAIVVKSNQGS